MLFKENIQIHSPLLAGIFQQLQMNYKSNAFCFDRHKNSSLFHHQLSTVRAILNTDTQ